MDKPRRWLGAIVCLAALALAAPPAPAASGGSAGSGGPSLEEQLQQQQDSLNSLQAQMAQTQRQLQAAKVQVAAAMRRAHAAQAAVDQEQGYLDDLLARLARARTEVQQRTVELKTAQQQLAHEQDLLNRRVQAIYEQGEVGFLTVLLDAHNFGDFLTRFDFLKDVVAADAALFRQVKADRDAVQQKEQAAEHVTAQLQSLQAQADAQLKVLQANRAAADHARAVAVAQESDVAAEAEAQAASSARIQQLIQGLRHAIYRRTHGNFSLIWPVDGPITITSPFGWRFHPILHKYELHTGTDIAEDTGTPIHAAEDGQVIYAGWMTGYGNIVLIDHGDVNGHDISTGYAHQSRIAVREGQDVRQGQVIGYVGSTGWATGPHLHFEVRVDGTPVNPIDWLP